MKENQKVENTSTARNMLTGMFTDRKSTENAYNTLQEKGYSKDDINLVMSDHTHKKHFSSDVKETKIAFKGTESARKGSTVGTIAAAVSSFGKNFALPRHGIVVAGPIAAGIAGGVAGSITGGIIGTLVGLGIPEARAKLYELGIKNGNIIMGVHPRNDEDAKYFENNWRSNKGEVVRY